jgi:glucan phosphoethanolaminetransferase (alkaline phosphatase superfamily)
MISAVNIDFSGILIDLIMIVFFGIGAVYTLTVGIVHRIKKRTRTVGYYFVSFLVSGLMGLLIAGLVAFLWAMSL